MSKLTAGIVGLAVLMLGAGMTPSLALAKCAKDCKKQFSTELKTCKSACTKGKTGRTCRDACRTTAKAEKVTCKHATPPSCSPSGAFLH